MIIEMLTLLACLSAPAVAAGSSSSGGRGKKKTSDSGGAGGGVWLPKLGEDLNRKYSDKPSSIERLGNYTPPTLPAIQAPVLSSMTELPTRQPFTLKSYRDEEQDSVISMAKRFDMIENTYRRCRASGLL